MLQERVATACNRAQTGYSFGPRMRLLPCLFLAQLAPAVPAETLRGPNWEVTLGRRVGQGPRVLASGNPER